VHGVHGVPETGPGLAEGVPWHCHPSTVRCYQEPIPVAGCAPADISEFALSDAREEWEQAASAATLLGTPVPAEGRRGEALPGSEQGPGSKSPCEAAAAPAGGGPPGVPSCSFFNLDPCLVRSASLAPGASCIACQCHVKASSRSTHRATRQASTWSTLAAGPRIHGKPREAHEGGTSQVPHETLHHAALLVQWSPLAPVPASLFLWITAHAAAQRPGSRRGCGGIWCRVLQPACSGKCCCCPRLCHMLLAVWTAPAGAFLLAQVVSHPLWHLGIYWLIRHEQKAMSLRCNDPVAPRSAVCMWGSHE